MVVAVMLHRLHSRLHQRERMQQHQHRHRPDQHQQTSDQSRMCLSRLDSKSNYNLYSIHSLVSRLIRFCLFALCWLDWPILTMMLSSNWYILHVFQQSIRWFVRQFVDNVSTFYRATWVSMNAGWYHLFAFDRNDDVYECVSMIEQSRRAGTETIDV